MLAVQMRNPGRGYPPTGPWPHWNDLAGESMSMVDEIHSKLASKRQEMAPFHTGKLRDATCVRAQVARHPKHPHGRCHARAGNSPHPRSDVIGSCIRISFGERGAWKVAQSRFRGASEALATPPTWV